MVNIGLWTFLFYQNFVYLKILQTSMFSFISCWNQFLFSYFSAPLRSDDDRTVCLARTPKKVKCEGDLLKNNCRPASKIKFKIINVFMVSLLLFMTQFDTMKIHNTIQFTHKKTSSIFVQHLKSAPNRPNYGPGWVVAPE